VGDIIVRSSLDAPKQFIKATLWSLAELISISKLKKIEARLKTRCIPVRPLTSLWWRG